jgi:hypothetical protein
VRRADHSSRGVLPSVVCLIWCDLETSTIGRIVPSRACQAMKNNVDLYTNFVFLLLTSGPFSGCSCMCARLYSYE